MNKCACGAVNCALHNPNLSNNLVGGQIDVQLHTVKHPEVKGLRELLSVKTKGNLVKTANWISSFKDEIEKTAKDPRAELIVNMTEKHKPGMTAEEYHAARVEQLKKQVPKMKKTLGNVGAIVGGMAGGMLGSVVGMGAKNSVPGALIGGAVGATALGVGTSLLYQNNAKRYADRYFKDPEILKAKSYNEYNKLTEKHAGLLSAATKFTTSPVGKAMGSWPGAIATGAVAGGAVGAIAPTKAGVKLETDPLGFPTGRKIDRPATSRKTNILTGMAAGAALGAAGKGLSKIPSKHLPDGPFVIPGVL